MCACTCNVKFTYSHRHVFLFNSLLKLLDDLQTLLKLSVYEMDGIFSFQQLLLTFLKSCLKVYLVGENESK